MAQIIRLWWPLLVAVALIQMGNGITGSLVSVTSEAAGFGPLLKGLVLSGFYIGSLAGAWAAPTGIQRLTHVGSFIFFTIFLAGATAGFAAGSDPYVWVALRLAAGFAITGMFVTVESWLNLGTKDGWRARVFAVYLFVQLGGLAAGQMLLNARDAGDAPLFLAAAACAAASIVFLAFESVRNPAYIPPQRLSLAEFARRAPLGTACIALAGFAWAGLMASGPALVEVTGFSDFAKSMFMALLIVSGMIAQAPIGWAADHADSRLVIAGSTAAAGAAALLGLTVAGVPAVFAFAAIFGAATFPLYAVGVARANEVLLQSERTAASAVMIVFFQAGAIAAPFALAFATEAAGPAGYFAVMAAPQFALAAVALIVVRRGAPQAGAEGYKKPNA